MNNQVAYWLGAACLTALLANCSIDGLPEDSSAGGIGGTGGGAGAAPSAGTAGGTTMNTGGVTSGGGTAGDSSSAGVGGEDVASAGAAGAAAETCEENRVECLGAAQTQRRTCKNGAWQSAPACTNGDLCDSRDGSCAPIAAGCKAHAPGALTCDGENLTVCGPDLVTTETKMACEGKCVVLAAAADCASVSCGDGKIQAPEQCDNGNANNNTSPGACRTSCKSAYCGDGTTDPGNQETCDSGDQRNDTVKDACRSNCKKAHCGDGVVDTGEECDDAGTSAGNGCGATCTVEAGYECSGSPSSCSPLQPTITAVTSKYGSTAGGVSISISGTKFQAGAGLSVKVGGNAAPITSSSATTIVVTTPAASTNVVGPVDVVVTNANRKTAKAVRAFTYYWGTLKFGAMATADVSTAQPTGLGVGDFDGDGDLDVAYGIHGAGASASTIDIFLNDGTGQLGNRKTEPNLQGSTALVVTKFNDDDFLDLVSTGSGNGGGVSVKLGNGNGTFSSPTSLAPGYYSYALGVGLLNNDAFPDVAFGALDQNSFFVSYGDGNGKVGSPLPQPADLSDKGYRYVSVGDVTCDGKDDLVGVSQDAKIRILQGNGDGTFANKYVDLMGQVASSFGRAPILADVDGDGCGDLTVVEYGKAKTWILRSTGGGFFDAAKSFVTPANTDTISIEDIDGDGRPDLLIGTYETQDTVVGIRANRTEGQTLAFAAVQSLTAGKQCDAVLSRDMNKDGRLDLVVGNYSSNNVGVLLGQHK